ADLTARRHALEHAAREHDDRVARLADEIAAVEAALEQVEAKGRADLAPLAKAAESTQTAVAEAEAAALRAEAAHSAARQALDVARGPLAEAERRGQRLDTEAKTLAKLLHVDAKKLWPPPPSMPPIRRCRTASTRWAITSRRRKSWRDGWRKSE